MIDPFTSRAARENITDRVIQDTRAPVWEALSEMWLDTPTDHAAIAHSLHGTGYDLASLEYIAFHEVAPILEIWYYPIPAPPWSGYDQEWLQQKILAQKIRQTVTAKLYFNWLRYLRRDDWQLIKNYLAAF